MRVDLLTREYPPEVYGGAGVHVAELTKALRSRLDVVVRCFGADRDEPGVQAFRAPAELADANATLSTLGVDLQMAQAVQGADLVHSHTWYANMGGHLAKLLHGIPHVVTAHSLEPLRPWKAEQLGGGYRISSFAERTAYEHADAVIAVSRGMGDDILRCYPAVDPARLHVVYNGIDLERWKPTVDTDTVRALGVDPDRPTIIFVGRITRQKGLPYLLRAAKQLPAEVQLVLCAGAPDTKEIMAEVSGLVADLQQERSGVVWIERILPQQELSALLTAADVFVCPSVYEPLGIVNLEAMACATAVVGTATGGIPEVIVDRETGRLVPIEQATDGTGTPLDPDRFVAALAAALTEGVSDRETARRYGEAGRARAEAVFDWDAIGAQTAEIYASLTGS